MPKEKKKKTYLVDVEVDMCAEHHVNVTFVATNESIACRKATEECLKDGYFFAIPMSCKRIDGKE